MAPQVVWNLPLNIKTLLTLASITVKAAQFYRHRAQPVYARLSCQVMDIAAGAMFTTVLIVHYQRQKKTFTTGC